MTRREIYESSMFLAVEDFLSKNKSSFAKFPAIVEFQKKLVEKNGTIRNLMQAQANDTSVESEQKKLSKNALYKSGVKVIDGLKAYSAANNDLKIKTMVGDMTEYKLKRFHENDLIIQLKKIHDIALPIANELKILGVTADDITILDAQSEVLKKSNPSIHNIRGISVQATSDLKTTIKETKKMLKEILDPLMLPFKTLDSSLHGEYLHARLVVEKASSHKNKKISAVN